MDARCISKHYMLILNGNGGKLKSNSQKNFKTLYVDIKPR